MKKILISVTSLLLALMLTVPVFAETAASTDTASALTEAQEAYKAAKQSQNQTDYEAELKAMVEAGTLTQEQADLLLAASKEQTALKNGVCPNCGYEFQTSFSVKKNKNSKKDSASDDSTALEQAQSAYAAAREASELTDYEAELKAMVEAGTLTQEQADLLLTAAKEAYALSNGVCPNCGYEFQTTTVTGKYSYSKDNYSYKSGKSGKH